MGKTLTIEEVKSKEVYNTGNFLRRYYTITEFKFKVRFPDGVVKYAIYDSIKNYDPQYHKINEQNRITKLQELINYLEDDGYRVETNYLALFMNEKISLLIMKKK